jgi:geranylgeranyl transferase type-2 subunit alpha
LKEELELTFQCLQNNPKSYGAWHHRCWTMLKLKNPDWDNELALCSKFLLLDERNFHCWDYRRFVVKHNTNISAQDELNYSYEKIEDKIENYSAWHYRSKLLPLTDPGIEQNGVQTISESKRREELDMVLDAVFVDPADSSAWIYHKWLLSSPNIDVTKPICCLIRDNRLQVSFSRPVTSSDFVIVSSEEKSAITTKEWRSVTGQKFDSLWISELVLPASTTVCVEMVNGSSSSANQSLSVVADKVCHTFQQSENMDQETYKVLEKDLENCNLLLDPEMELLEDDTNTKWPLYTKVLIMKAMDPKKFHT